MLVFLALLSISMVQGSNDFVTRKLLLSVLVKPSAHTGSNQAASHEISANKREVPRGSDPLHPVPRATYSDPLHNQNPPVLPPATKVVNPTEQWVGANKRDVPAGPDPVHHLQPPTSRG